MSKRPKINHLARLGLERNRNLATDKPTIDILGRRSRKDWPCSAGDRCSIGYDIGLDEVYVEHAVGTARYLGETFRYHVACAINAQVVLPVDQGIDKGNNRRQAIQAQRARKAANAG